MKPRWPYGLAVAMLAWGAGAHAGVWFTDSGRAQPTAIQAIELLEQAPTHGLEAEDYQTPALRDWVQRAVAQTLTAEQTLVLEQALTTQWLRYLKDVHQGRIDPREIQQDFNVERLPPFDARQALDAAIALQDLEASLRAAQPAYPQYQRLREALQEHRQRIGHPAWAQPLAPLPRTAKGAPKLKPGHAYASLPQLVQRLEALGDLPPGALHGNRYDEPLVQAVRRFQERHGLDVDGVIGKATLAHLEITPEQRAHQIALTLERLRWTPLFQGPRMVVINLPEFMLRAYEVVGDRVRLKFESKVVVGQSLDTRTPMFDEDMRFIEFSPYWNVPPSIARAETVPRLRRDPGYLDKQGFEFVAPDGQVFRHVTPQRLNAVLAGQMRLRQRPGPMNALGDIKFVFPNKDHIFLHHTPAVQLFERQRRDFSHGCIRVERPVDLAEFVMSTMPGWTSDHIQAAMVEGVSQTVRLSEPVPVLIAYGTTVFKQGRIFFFDDIYGHDALLDQALRSRPKPPVVPLPSP